jgi:hypothetical protein
VEAKLAPTTPVEVHDPNDQVGEVTLTVGQDGSARFRRCKALTAPGPGPDC